MQQRAMGLGSRRERILLNDKNQQHEQERGREDKQLLNR
jgi:hypothetical protein